MAGGGHFQLSVVLYQVDFRVGISALLLVSITIVSHELNDQKIHFRRIYEADIPTHCKSFMCLYLLC